MLIYLWIAIGGALGSVSRAWIAIAVARVTGPQFPWGTVLINIVGSFVIGFFGTLTASDSRFAVPVDLRAFVMIGFCGGFTTFSSFSLQTLELARDGRMLQALGNVGLSVILCLAAVAAGYYSGAGLHRGFKTTAAISATPASKVALVVLDRPEEAEGLLTAAARLLATEGGGRIEALTVRMPPVAALLPSEEVLTANREAALRAEWEDWAGRLRAIVSRWTARAGSASIRADLIDVEGDAADIVANMGRRADSVVIAQPSEHGSERARHSLHAALFDTGCKVLAVPPGSVGALGRTVAIAWKDDVRANEAVRASLPILHQARAVHVLCADQEPMMPPILREHGILAVLHAVPDGGGPTGERLLDAAHGVGADMLVMGAFAHGEWRERLLGGVTRTMLSHADLPLLLRH